MVTIAVDAMSGDRGYEVVITAIKKLIAKDKDVKIILVGRKQDLEPKLDDIERVQIHDAPEVIQMTDNPLSVLRKRKSSMFQTVNLVNEKQADAALSCGNTGALMGMARIQLKMLEGFSRPAIAFIYSL